MLPLVLQLSLAGVCPQGQTQVDTFSYNGAAWTACEDLSTQGGALVLVPKTGKVLQHLLPSSPLPELVGASPSPLFCSSTSVFIQVLAAGTKPSLKHSLLFLFFVVYVLFFSFPFLLRFPHLPNVTRTH